jgi:hypothetical protein
MIWHIGGGRQRHDGRQASRAKAPRCAEKIKSVEKDPLAAVWSQSGGFASEDLSRGGSDRSARYRLRPYRRDHDGVVWISRKTTETLALLDQITIRFTHPIVI